jgi:hypothetical protein
MLQRRIRGVGEQCCYRYRQVGQAGQVQRLSVRM